MKFTDSEYHFYHVSTSYLVWTGFYLVWLTMNCGHTRPAWHRSLFEIRFQISWSWFSESCPLTQAPDFVFYKVRLRKLLPLHNF